MISIWLCNFIHNSYIGVFLLNFQVGAFHGTFWRILEQLVFSILPYFFREFKSSRGGLVVTWQPETCTMISADTYVIISNDWWVLPRP